MTPAKAKAPAAVGRIRGQESGAATMRPQSVYEARMLQALAAPPDTEPDPPERDG